jgi:hypothetical protein
VGSRREREKAKRDRERQRVRATRQKENQKVIVCNFSVTVALSLSFPPSSRIIILTNIGFMQKLGAILHTNLRYLNSVVIFIQISQGQRWINISKEPCVLILKDSSVCTSLISSVTFGH